jgi:hypothetical protein
MGWITQRAFAELLGVSGAAVSKAVKRGRLSGATRPTESGVGVEIDESEGVRLWHANNGRPDLLPHVAPAPPAQRKRTKADPGPRDLPGADVSEDQLPEVAISRKRTEHFKALQTELDYRRDAGDLVPIDEVGKAVEREYANVKARLLAIKVSLAPDLVGVDDPVVIEALIEQHIIEALQELSEPHAVGTTGASPSRTEAAA